MKHGNNDSKPALKKLQTPLGAGAGHPIATGSNQRWSLSGLASDLVRDVESDRRKIKAETFMELAAFHGVPLDPLPARGDPGQMPERDMPLTRLRPPRRAGCFPGPCRTSSGPCTRVSRTCSGSSALTRLPWR